MAATAKTRMPGPSVEPTEYPHFETDEEARRFWSSHSTAPYWHLMEDVSYIPPSDLIERPFGTTPQARKRPKPGETAEITAHLSAEMVDVLSGFARQRQQSLDSLLAEWLGDRIKEERRRLHGDLDLPEDADRST